MELTIYTNIDRVRDFSLISSGFHRLGAEPRRGLGAADPAHAPP
jgi:hypothetical protein